MFHLVLHCPTRRRRVLVPLSVRLNSFGKAVKPDRLYRDVILGGDTGEVLCYELRFRSGRHMAADNLEDNIKFGASKEETGKLKREYLCCSGVNSTYRSASLNSLSRERK